MKRLINHMKRLFIKDIKKVPVGVGTELIVQVENVYEEVKTHKKVKKHHGKNKGPKWFREFADRIEAKLDEHSKDIAEIKTRLNAIEEKLDRNKIF